MTPVQALVKRQLIPPVQTFRHNVKDLTYAISSDIQALVKRLNYATNSDVQALVKDLIYATSSGIQALVKDRKLLLTKDMTQCLAPVPPSGAPKVRSYHRV